MNFLLLIAYTILALSYFYMLYKAIKEHRGKNDSSVKEIDQQNINKNYRRYVKQSKNGLELTKEGNDLQIEKFCNSPMGQRYINEIIPEMIKQHKNNQNKEIKDE